PPRKPRPPDRAPAPAGWKGLLELLDERQCRGPEAPLGPGIGDNGPADGERATSDDDARQPAPPSPEPGRVQGDHHGLLSRQERERQTDQRWTDRRLSERRSAPPAPHPSQARPARTGVLGL